ncbi:hypothetical protein [Aureivirga marina]|nr:hypothetical protein [Aureivirga marina]
MKKLAEAKKLNKEAQKNINGGNRIGCPGGCPPGEICRFNSCVPGDESYG